MTRPRRLVLFCLLAFACGDDEPSPDASVGLDSSVSFDGGLDAEMPDSNSLFDSALDAVLPDTSSDAPLSDARPDAFIPLGDDGLLPVITNFRIGEANRDRLYFDSSEGISASDASGFTVSGNTIASITVVPGSGNGHYFTVAQPFTFWDNTLIRYEGGSDLRDNEDNGLHAFHQEYVVNNIPEPAATGTTYFVSTTGSDSNDGQSEGSPWRTLSYALSAPSSVDSGDTIYVEAGDYGDEHVVTRKNSGAEEDDAPIFVLGYQNTPGDSPDLGWSHPTNTELDPSVMPLFRGDGTGKGFLVRGDNLIFKNLQITNYGTGFHGIGPRQRVLLDNLIVTHAARGEYTILFDADGAHANRITNTVAYNAGTVLIRFYGTNLLIDNATCIQDEGGVDYYIVVRGNDNIVRNSHLEHYVDRGHSGHGISVKSVGVPTEFGLYEALTIVGIRLSIEARHDEVRHNYFHDIEVWRRPERTSRANSGGIIISHGANNNVFDSIHVTDAKEGISFYTDTIEDPTAESLAHHNHIINSTFRSNERVLRTDGHGTTLESYENLIENCTFDDNDALFLTMSDHSRSNVIRNSQITGTGRRENALARSGYSFSFSNFFNNSGLGVPEGEGNVGVDPMYRDGPAGDLHLRAESPEVVRSGGRTGVGARYDCAGVERPEERCSIGACEQR